MKAAVYESIKDRVKLDKELDLLLVDNTIQYVIGQMLGQIIKTGLPKHYLGDFYHDMIWTQENWAYLTAHGYFYWGLRTCGTSIGTDRDLVVNYSEKTFCCVFPPNPEYSIKP